MDRQLETVSAPPVTQNPKRKDGKSMKKLLPIILAAAMVFSLAACTRKTSGNSGIYS
jgi:hypothetical protein